MQSEYPQLCENRPYYELDSITQSACKSEWRMLKDSRPIICVSGYGESGKDTVAMMLSERLALTYDHSTSRQACYQMYRQINIGWFDRTKTPGYDFKWWHRWSYFEAVREKYDTSAMIKDPSHMTNPDAWYASRHLYREFWAEWIRCYNMMSPLGIQLYLDHLRGGTSILTGIRQKEEIERMLNFKIIDMLVWVDRPGKGPANDPTQQYTSELADYIINNDGTTADLEAKVDKLVRTIQRFNSYLTHHQL